MIPAWKERRVCELLARGMPYRKIAKEVGVCRSTVIAIANGHRLANLSDAHDVMAGEVFSMSEPAERCPTCGYKVYMPCLACRVRALVKRHATEQSTDRDSPSGRAAAY